MIRRDALKTEELAFWFIFFALTDFQSEHSHHSLLVYTFFFCPSLLSVVGGKPSGGTTSKANCLVAFSYHFLILFLS